MRGDDAVIRGYEVLWDENFARLLRDLRDWWDEVVEKRPLAVPGVCNLPLLNALIRQTFAHEPYHPRVADLLELRRLIRKLDDRMHDQYGKREPGYSEIAVLGAFWRMPSGMVEVGMTAERDLEEGSSELAVMILPRGEGERGLYYMCPICAGVSAPPTTAQ